MAESIVSPDLATGRGWHAEPQGLARSLRGCRLTLLLGEHGATSTALLTDGLLPLLRRRSDDAVLWAPGTTPAPVQPPAQRRRTGAAEPQAEVVVLVDAGQRAPDGEFRASVDAALRAVGVPHQAHPVRPAPRLRQLGRTFGARFLCIFDRFDEVLAAPHGGPRDTWIEETVELLDAHTPANLLVAMDARAQPLIAPLLRRLPHVRAAVYRLESTAWRLAPATPAAPRGWARLPATDASANANVNADMNGGTNAGTSAGVRTEDIYAEITRALAKSVGVAGVVVGHAPAVTDAVVGEAPVVVDAVLGAAPAVADAVVGEAPAAADAVLGAAPAVAGAVVARAPGAAGAVALRTSVPRSPAAWPPDPRTPSWAVGGVRVPPRAPGRALAVPMPWSGAPGALGRRMAWPGWAPVLVLALLVAVVAVQMRRAPPGRAGLPPAATDRGAAQAAGAAPSSRLDPPPQVAALAVPAFDLWADTDTEPDIGTNASTDATPLPRTLRELVRQLNAHGDIEIRAVPAHRSPTPLNSSPAHLVVLRHDILQAAAGAPNPPALGIVAPLYREPIVVLVRAQAPWRYLHQLEGLRINVGAADGLRAQTARQLYERMFGQPLRRFPAADLEPTAALRLLAAGGTLDAVLWVGPPPARFWLDQDPALRGAFRVLALDASHPASRRALQAYLPATWRDDGNTATPTLASLAFLAYVGVPSAADAVGLRRVVGALCAGLPALQRDGDAAWREVTPGRQLPTAWPNLPATAAAWAACGPSALADSPVRASFHPPTAVAVSGDHP